MSYESAVRVVVGDVAGVGVRVAFPDGYGLRPRVEIVLMTMTVGGAFDLSSGEAQALAALLGVAGRVAEQRELATTFRDRVPSWITRMARAEAEGEAVAADMARAVAAGEREATRPAAAAGPSSTTRGAAQPSQAAAAPPPPSPEGATAPDASPGFAGGPRARDTGGPSDS